MDQKIREIEEKLSSEYHRGELGIVSGEPIMEDIKYLLSHISTLEEKVKELREGIAEVLDGTLPYLAEQRLKKVLEGK